ncbi:MAG: amino acid adenylation domain-containing protein [Opitutaceae bacterium]|nr:amino acid adenylation domain-containing protein [Opitutaceae bacterium]
MSVATPSNVCLRQPLTAAQMDIWLEQSVRPQSTQYHISPYYLIPLALDVDRFIGAANWVLSHYDALYARLSPGPEGVPELVLDPTQAPRCEFLDLTGEADPPAALQALIRRRAHTPFQILDSCLARPTLIKTGPASFCYSCNYHHLVIDGWGAGIVFPRIAKAYDDLGHDLEPQIEGSSFADYLRACQEPPDDRALARSIAFWKPLLAAPMPFIPLAHAGGEEGDEPATSHAEITLSRGLADRVAQQAATANATLFHAFLLAYGHLIGRQYSLESCALSLPILNRSKEHKETIGFFTELRTAPLPLDENASVGENLHAVSRRIREVFRHYRVSAAELARLYQSHGNAGAPTSHSTVSYITRDYGASIEGTFLPMRHVPPAHEGSPFTLFVFDIYPGKDIRLELVYQQQRMNRDEAGLFLRRLLHFFAGLDADPQRKLGELDLVPPEERRRIAACLRRDETPPASRRLVIESILERARLCPAATAVETMDSRRSYREIVAQANALAHRLVQQHGVVPGDRVALLFPRGADLVASYLAAMMTGAAFVPIDSSAPEAWARQICGDAGAKCLLSHAPLAAKAQAIHPSVLLADEVAPTGGSFAPRAAPDLTAYIIYTSGSTGKPKGVEIVHRTLADHLSSWFSTVPMRTGDERMLYFCSPAFDASIETVFPALMLGNTIVTAPHPQWPAHEMPQVIKDRRLTALFLPPAYLLEMLKYLRDKPDALAGHGVHLCLTGGDVMHAESAVLWNAVFGSSAKLFNVYGPTETTVTATMFEVPGHFRAEPGESVPIGRPHAGRILRIVNERGKDIPIGVEGELLIGGIGLAKGYHGMSAETQNRFVVLEDGVRYYRSGDIVRLKGDGNIVFRRRRDNQVKIRGFRVEPDEIEACALANAAVRECAVLACPSASDGEKELRAYVSFCENSAEDGRTLRAYLLTRLPSYMVPSIVVLDRLPQNVSGKIDRRALLAPRAAPDQPRRGDSPVHPPQGPVQEYLAALWEQTLGRKVDDARADFFEQGGHSLLAAKLIAKIGKSFRVDYPFAAFFDQPTIETIEHKLEQLVGDKTTLEKMARLRLELVRMTPAEIEARLESARQKDR